mgnify:CR=1 FL=1
MLVKLFESVIVFNHPDLTNPAGTSEAGSAAGRVVSADGKIFFPFVGEVEVAGRRVELVGAKDPDFSRSCGQ